LDHVAVRSLDDRSCKLHRVEFQIGQHLGDALPLKLCDRGIGNVHQSSYPGAFVSHDRLPSVASAPRYQKICLRITRGPDDPFADHGRRCALINQCASIARSDSTLAGWPSLLVN
jgi:hypothetical protein